MERPAVCFCKEMSITPKAMLQQVLQQDVSAPAHTCWSMALGVMLISL
jgi:hypothetical protein